MKRLGRYVLACIALVAVTGAVLTTLLPPGTGAGLWFAGIVACLVQASAAAARVRWGGRPERLLAVMGWGAGGRLAVIGAAAFAAYRYEALHPVSTLVGLAGYLFAMLLMEPALLRPGSTIQTGTR